MSRIKRALWGSAEGLHLRYYTKIPVWENKRRLSKLAEFRGRLSSYFNNSRADWMEEDRIEGETAQEARVQLNRSMDEVHTIMLCAGINPRVTWTPPATVGGYVQNVDLIQNIFNIQRFSICAKYVLDFIDRAIGVYEANRRKAFARTINPLFYVGLMLDWLGSVPFAIIGRIGFDRDKAESSTIGRLVKGLLYLITVLASALTALQLLGYLDVVRNFVQKAF